MTNEKDKNLELIEAKLKFLRRHVQNISTEDFDAIDVGETAIALALRALQEYVLSLNAIREEASFDVYLADYNVKNLPEMSTSGKPSSIATKNYRRRVCDYEEE